MSYSITQEVERIGHSIALNVHAREERWARALMAQHFPGVKALVDSRQLKAAMVHLRAFGIHRAVYPDGTVQLRQGDRVIGELKPLEVFPKAEPFHPWN